MLADSNQDNLSLDAISSLNRIAVSGLLQMFDGHRNLFCERLVRTRHDLTRERPSYRDTLIALLGLLHFENFGGRSPIDVRRVLSELLDVGRVESLSDLGLLLWVCAEAGLEFARRVCSELDMDRALSRFREGRQACTLSLAWFISGLTHLTLAGQGHFRDVAEKAYSLLRQNQGEFGLFSHLAETGSLSGLMRGRLGSFADQIFSVYGLAKFSHAFDSRRATEKALDCALTLCELQGSMGQWWWHYDAATGKVVGRYPVYSVNQYALAPMAFRTLGETVQSDFSVWIDRGMRWIFGENELEQDLRDLSSNVIWDAVGRRDHLRRIQSAIQVLSMHEDTHPHRDLSLVWECRAANLGWLLFAWAEGAALVRSLQPAAVATSEKREEHREFRFDSQFQSSYWGKRWKSA